MTRTYQICKRCIMDTTDPLIHFDENGSCNHCRNYETRARNELFKGDAASEKLNQLVSKIKLSGRGKEYDAVIGVSGGVDSSMVAYHAKETLGLRVLAVHFDNGWNSELAVSNIKTMLSKLDIDLYTYVMNWQEFRDLQLAFLRASVPNCEIPTDHAINAILYETAAKHDIKYILGGGNLATEGILPVSWGYYNLDYRHLKAIHKRFSDSPMKTLPVLPLWKFVFNVFVRKIKTVSILNYLEYSKTEATQFLESNLGWRPYGGKHYESIYTRFFQGYILPTKFGFDKRRAHYSTLIMSGDMSRDDALAAMQTSPYDANQFRDDREFVIKKFKITESEFDKIMAAPVKQHTEYPTNRLFFENFVLFKNWFKRKAQGN